MHKRLKVTVSIAAVLLATAHLAFPSIAIDATTLILLFVALIPWILPFVKTIEIPGVGSIELKDAKAATEKITKIITPETGAISVSKEPPSLKASVGDTDLTSLWTVFEADPNLALVGFRIELEKRLRQLAERAGIQSAGMPLSRIARELESKEVLPREVVSGIVEIVALGNQAAHGATVQPNAARWVLDVGPSILNQLDRSRDA